MMLETTPGKKRDALVHVKISVMKHNAVTVLTLVLLDLMGLEARLTADGPAIGTVSDLISGGNDLLEITTTDGRKLLIPFVEAIVPEVQLEEGWLLLTPPPGLLEL